MLPAFVDRFGRETVSWVRTFESTRTRRFDAYMVYGEARGGIVDYLGSHEHLAVDIDLTVDERGGLRLRSGAQRFYDGSAARRTLNGHRVVLGPWHWKLIVYLVDEREDVVSVVSIQDARSSAAATHE